MADAPLLDPELQVIADEAMADVQAGRIGPREVEGIWWDRRRDNELTSDYLGRVLAEAGCIALARNARACHYDDYFAPPEVSDGLETLRLVRDLRRVRREMEQAGKAAGVETGIEASVERVKVVEDAVKAGEFDSTKEESDRWARSESGQAAFRELSAPAVSRMAKVGRNEPCPCGSGRKYKFCHGR